MPELAEVRVVKKALEKRLLNKKITSIDVIYPKIIESNSLDINTLVGKELKKIDTYGKYLIFVFDGIYMISHLRMEGKYFIKDINLPIEKHEHVIFTFDKDISLRYHDTRKFGRMFVCQNISDYKSLKKLGKEPFDISKEELYSKLSKINKPIKDCLLDQSIIAGLGNIYANEVLFACKINPHKKACLLSIIDADNIIKESIKILNKSIKCGGCTIKSYTSSLGVIGHYQEYLCVHMQKKCKICGSDIACDKISGRSTYYCEKCQSSVE